MRYTLAAAALLPLTAMASPGPKAVPDPVITPAAVLQGRQEADETIVGWVNTRGSFISVTCPTGSTWSQSGSNGYCCNTAATNCNMPTGCRSRTLVLLRSGTITCTYTDAPVCFTDIVYDNFGDDTPVFWVGCDSPRSAATFYRTEPNVSPSATDPTPISRSSSTTPFIPPTPTDPPEPEESKAWIAGAVIGAVVGVALIGGLIFFLLRRKGKKTTDPAAGVAPAPAPAGQLPPDMSQQYGHPGHMSMVGSPPPQYLDPSKGPVQHLDPSQQQQYAYPSGPTSPVMEYPPQQPGQEYQGAYYPDQRGQSPVQVPTRQQPAPVEAPAPQQPPPTELQ